MNSPSRYYVALKDWVDEYAYIRGDEAHHCVRVLRAKVGDEVEVFDGVGGFAKGKITELSKNEVKIQLGSRELQPSLRKIELVQTVPKAGNMEWIIQKAVELGVNTIVPLISENSMVKLDQSGKKIEKWRRVALEACKQCGQNYLPEIKPALKLAQWVVESREFDGKEVVAALDSRSRPLREVLHDRCEITDNIRVLVGPEGDFSTSEYQKFSELGMQFASLGDLILRVETATFYCLAAIRYEFEATEKVGD